MLKTMILNTFDSNKIKCAFVIKNLRTKEIISFHEAIMVPSASLIKIPIMACLLDEVENGRVNLNHKIQVDDEVKVEYSILTLLDSGNTYSLRDMATLMIVQSDNTATNILIDFIGLETINEYIKKIGLKNTLLQRKMMDLDARKKGYENYTTAEDMMLLLEKLWCGRLLSKKQGDFMLGIMEKQLDSGMMRLELPDNLTIYHKTGELPNIDHDVGIIFLDHNPYILTVLTWDAISNNYARMTIGRISKLIYEYYK